MDSLALLFIRYNKRETGGAVTVHSDVKAPLFFVFSLFVLAGVFFVLFCLKENLTLALEKKNKINFPDLIEIYEEST